jgi:hypothetical protein
LENIAEFDNNEDFFELCQAFNVHFGSFARKTQCRKLDDIDLMIGMSGNGATYNSTDLWNNVHITANLDDSVQAACARDDGTLNSTKVLNKFKEKLEHVREYFHSDVRRNQEAVVLNLISKDWSFDIVPCFHTVKEDNGRDYYLIPNGSGNWKKTDPLRDKEHVIQSNQEKEGRLLELIRLVKKWNEVNKIVTIPSYLLETMLVNYADSVEKLDEYIDFRFKNALMYISSNIFAPLYDMKAIQGDINELSYGSRFSIQNKAREDYLKACCAWEYEKAKNQKEAIGKWREILGEDFPAHE